MSRGEGKDNVAAFQIKTLHELRRVEYTDLFRVTLEQYDTAIEENLPPLDDLCADDKAIVSEHRRRIRNRISAKRSRKRKQQEKKELDEQLKRIRTEFEETQKKFLRLLEENTILRTLVGKQSDTLPFYDLLREAREDTNTITEKYNKLQESYWELEHGCDRAESYMVYLIRMLRKHHIEFTEPGAVIEGIRGNLV